MSVVDNVLLVHQVDAKVVILYDLFAESRAPVSAPLPLLLRGYPRSSMSSTISSKDDGSSDLKPANDDGSTIYREGWMFLNPDLICDTTNGLLWKIHIDLDVSSTLTSEFFQMHNVAITSMPILQAISASSSDVRSVLEFLQRRKLEAAKVVSVTYWQLVM